MTSRNGVALFAAGLALGAAGAFAMTGLHPEGTNSSRVVLENDRVRVKEAIFVPEDQAPGMHTHEYPHVGVVIDGGTLLFRYPDGRTERAELQRGGAGYREAGVTHEPVNLGKAPIRVIEVELK
jgi:hypothetical protein